jgi:hypothetical protein
VNGLATAEAAELLVGQGGAREADDALHALDAVLVARRRCMVHEIGMAQFVEDLEPPLEDHLVDEPLDYAPAPFRHFVHVPHRTGDRPTTDPKLEPAVPGKSSDSAAVEAKCPHMRRSGRLR